MDLLKHGRSVRRARIAFSIDRLVSVGIDFHEGDIAAGLAEDQCVRV